jgi:hypothetical protein
MTPARRLIRVALAALICVTAIEAGAWIGAPGLSGFVAPAEAVVGRPLTSVSVAGVGRRTLRRCAAGAYNC